MFIMRPVDAGYITFDKLLIEGDGALDASDILLMNQYLDVKNETERRAIEASKKE
jgi:hypothetical protein